MYWRYLIRFLLLTLGFGLTTLGLLAWQQSNFDLSHIWPLSTEFSAHPVYALILGLALIPPTLWEIFVLESGIGRGFDGGAESAPMHTGDSIGE